MPTDAASYRVGMLVRNEKAPGWGPGRILAVNGPTATVYFRDIPELKGGEAIKLMDITRGLLEILPSQSDSRLDNLPPFVDGRFQLTRPRLSMAQAIEAFSRRFPKGFDDPAYLGDRESGERNYKWEAHELWIATLGGGQGRRLLEQGNVTEVVRRALAVDGLLNLLAGWGGFGYGRRLNPLITQGSPVQIEPPIFRSVLTHPNSTRPKAMLAPAALSQLSRLRPGTI